MTDEKPFDPTPHLIPTRGGKLYLPVPPRVVWFRESCPINSGWGLRTRLVEGGFEKGYAVFEAEVVDPEGRVIASAIKSEDKAGFADFMEKANTGAVGRALSLCGFGTLQALDLDEGSERGEVVDSPQQRPGQRPAEDGRTAACEECGLVLTPAQAKLSENKCGGRYLCPAHQKAAA